MAKKASPNQAINTTAPIESCRILLNVFTNRQIAELGESAWGVGVYAQRLIRNKVPAYAIAEALKGRITSEDDAQAALMTARMLGPEKPDIHNEIYSLPPYQGPVIKF